MGGNVQHPVAGRMKAVEPTADGDQSHDEAREQLARPALVPTDISRFTSNMLFGQPGIYPGGPPMVPAAGAVPDVATARATLRDPIAVERYDRADLVARVAPPGVRAALCTLTGTAAAPVLDTFLTGQGPVRRLGLAVLPDTPGRVVGDDPGGDSGTRVVNARYAAEHPALVAPSLAHALLHHDTGASNAEEAVLHGLLAAVHVWLVAQRPELADAGTELARRQSSLAITLLNARSPGSWRASIRCPDAPNTIPGGNPALACPDLWSIPFTSLDPADAVLDAPAPLAECLARLASPGAPPPPSPLRYDDALGTWCTAHLGEGPWFGPDVRLAAGRALGLVGPAPPTPG